ncbi:MAG TPA: hypothetical protein VGJ84_19245, partial [Polyangiaceae bacterium]
MPKAVDRVGRSDWAGLSSGILAALLAAYAAYYGTSSDLTSFPDRVVGFAILAGVDPSRRLGTYFVMVAMAVGALLCVHYFARWLMQRLPGWHFGWRSRVENSLINTLCAISGVALVASVVTNHLKPSFAFVLPLCGVALLSTLTVARRLTMRRAQWRFLRRLTLWDTMTPMLFLLWACVFAVGVIFNLDQPPKWWFYPLAWMPAVLYIATYGVMATRRPGQPSPKLRRAFALGASPLLLFPFLCPVANELQFTLTQRHPTSPRAIALAFLSVLIVASVTGFVLALRGRLRFRPSKLAIWFCFPVVIASESWLSRYNHQLAALGEPIGLDQLLHLGERVTPVEQLVHFGKLPFVDLWPAHGLSDYLGAVYAWVNGFHPFEIAAWDGLLPALVRLLAFTTLAVVSTPFLAFATVLLLPADAFFAPPTHVYDFPLLGVPLLLLWAQRRPSRWRYAVLGSAITLSCFWMPAAGVACTVSAVTLLLLGLVSANQWREPAQKLVAFAAAALFLFFLYPVVLLVRHRSLGDTLQLIAGYIQSDPLIGGRPTIINQLDWLAFFQYVLLPSIGVGYLLVLIRRSFDRRPLDERQLVLSSLGLISMVLFARTLTRHGLIEGFQPLFFPFLGAAACFWSAGWRASPKELSTEAGFFGLFALYLMFFPS